MKLTLYQVLGTEPAASAEEIVAAHGRALAAFQQGAQDRNQGILLRDAFEVLSDPLKRSRYDASLRPREVSEPEPEEAPRRLWPKVLGLGMLLLVGSLWWLAKRTAVNKPAPPAPAQVTVVLPQQGEAAVRSAPAARVVRSAEELYAQLSGSVARIDILDGSGRQVGSGSGVAIGSSALITNCHVAKAGARLKVRIKDQVLDASITIADEEFDLCRLEVPGMAADAVAIGSSADMHIGQKVYALGAPRGLDLTISDGIVSSLRQSEKGTLIQTTAPVSPGSSGGGLFDTSGRLVGIVTFQFANGQNLNFAAPAEWISEMSTRSGTGLIGRREAGDADERPAEPARVSGGSQPVISGKWHCYDSIGGTGMDLIFHDNLSMTVIAAGKSAPGSYSFSGKSLFLNIGGQSFATAMEYKDDTKLVFSIRPGVRTVCQRQ